MGFPDDDEYSDFDAEALDLDEDEADFDEPMPDCTDPLAPTQDEELALEPEIDEQDLVAPPRSIHDDDDAMSGPLIPPVRNW